MINKLEKWFGRFAIPNLMNYIIGFYIVGYLVSLFDRSGSTIALLQLEPYMIIEHFQIWRLLSWLLIPPNTNIFFALIMMFFYWQLGRTLEQMWGTFRFNLYMFSGFIFTIAGAFILYFVWRVGGITDLAQLSDGMGNITTIRLSEFMGPFFSTSYINLSIFLAFSLTIPDMQVMLYFIIPIKMKWLAIVYAVITIYSFINTSVAGKVAIISSLLNFLLFFVSTRNFRNMNPREFKRRYDYKKATRQGRGKPFGQTPPFGGGRSTTYSGGQSTEKTANTQQERYQQNTAYREKNIQISRHRCSVCGRTEITNPELEFRFCSKCNGNYEYCNEHLFTHNHVE